MKTKHLILSVILFAVLSPKPAISQRCHSDQRRPTWERRGYFRDLGNSYIHVVRGFGSTIQEARLDASSDVVIRRNLATGGRFRTDGTALEGDLSVRSREIGGTFIERCGNRYQVTMLMQTAKFPHIAPERVEYSTNYSAGFRVLIPGWAQFYKQQPGRAWAFIGLSAGALFGAGFCEIRHRADMDDFRRTGQIFYLNRANDMADLRDIFLIGAGIVYLANIIEGLASRGNERVIDLDRNNRRFSFNPHITPQGGNLASGVALTINF